MSEGRARIPSATYRLQFHAGFTFRDAAGILDYLDDLGISDIYSSPFFQAAPESTHGYDVANHNRLNPAIGDESDFRIFASELRKRGMGQILDFVPNHMGIGQSLNAWWMSVLEDGIDSSYADYFDIDWHPGRKELADRVLLPILGDRYGKVLENGEFKLSQDKGKFFLHYFETRLPISPKSYPVILNAAAARLGGDVPEEMRGIVDLFASRGTREKAREGLCELQERQPAMLAAIDDTLRSLEGEAGKPESFDSLHELLEAQVYRLSYWRVAAEEINYRRFFDINTLAAIRVEIPEVFEAAHQFVFELLAGGEVTGMRIDHIDGLWDPRAYLRRLQERYALWGGGGDKSLYLVVEKILDPTRERIPSDWPVHGTTGYEFANQAVQLFMDSNAEKRMTKIFEKFTGFTDSFADLIYEKKKLTMQISLSSEIATLGRMLDGLSEMNRQYRDFTRNTLTSVVEEVVACFPVYRTYATAEGMTSPEDERNVLRAILAARRRNPGIEKSVFDFLRGVLLLRIPENFTPEQREAHVRFVMKFQQCSGPVMAKGLEDTSFYIYNRLIALNEVGGDPGLFGIEAGEFHRLNAVRQETMPHTLLATSTHDTKKSEDVRVRIAVLSEIPNEWRDALKRWSRMNRKARSAIQGEFAPSRNEEYLLYQAMLGSWPLSPADRPAYTARIQQYMLKALKEAKLNSSWTEPNEEWENAVSLFVETILDENRSGEFLADFVQMADRIARVGAMNALAQTVLKSTVPGVPDFYQGTEAWDFSLVDPDNRRPVDYAGHRRLVESLRGVSPGELLEDWKSGRIKIHFTRTLLRFRREHSDFFCHADYQPMEVVGLLASHVVAFSRSWEGNQLVVLVPRLTAALGDFPVEEIWRDTQVALPSGNWTDILTGNIRKISDAPLVSGLLSDFPAAVLFNEQN